MVDDTQRQRRQNGLRRVGSRREKCRYIDHQQGQDRQAEDEAGEDKPLPGRGTNKDCRNPASGQCGQQEGPEQRMNSARGKGNWRRHRELTPRPALDEAQGKCEREPRQYVSKLVGKRGIAKVEAERKHHIKRGGDQRRTAESCYRQGEGEEGEPDQRCERDGHHAPDRHRVLAGQIGDERQSKVPWAAGRVRRGHRCREEDLLGQGRAVPRDGPDGSQVIEGVGRRAEPRPGIKRSQAGSDSDGRRPP